MGKGSRVRPAEISQTEWQKRYEETFKPKPNLTPPDVKYLKSMFFCSRCGDVMPMDERFDHGPSWMCHRPPVPNPEPKPKKGGK